MIEIDPNVRSLHNNTWVYMRPADVGDLKAGDAVVVWQSEMKIAWPATIVELTHSKPLDGEDDYFVEFDVAWEKWKHV